MGELKVFLLGCAGQLEYWGFALVWLFAVDFLDSNPEHLDLVDELEHVFLFVFLRCNDLGSVAIRSHAFLEGRPALERLSCLWSYRSHEGRMANCVSGEVASTINILALSSLYLALADLVVGLSLSNILVALEVVITVILQWHRCKLLVSSFLIIKRLRIISPDRLLIRHRI